ncbi:Hsp33 family molecular chaperone HslO [Jeotgalibaca arthritidis]|uniref:33 kDa chaperonin n=1 Tax=Jeotgalibaca arthritidis TaxID=1868794 RepID=A0A6G7K8G4_9LACT|nr:Hsp33 family molecular chaperone HslO [Jeotgalibaca arthritidis]QII81545.1 Hsp33 family molecular chaperone HslO [Jeotgalibaca arthritidis]
MSDYLVKGLAYEGQFRVYAVDATETVGEAQRRHDTWSASSAALGRTMVGSILIATTGLKAEQKMSVIVNGNGVGGRIIVDANGQGDVKGYITNPHVSLPLNGNGKLDVRGVVGTEGLLTVIKDLGLKEPFTGQVPLVSGELGEDFTYYMANSEQIPSAVGLSVLVDTDDSIKIAGGFMIQVLPGASEAAITSIEKNLADMPLVSRLMEKGVTPEEVLERILGKENIRFVEKMPVQFKCDCSHDRFKDGLAAVGKEELEAIIKEDKGAEVICQFCGEKYHYSEEELTELLVDIQK